jgi:hypothetical protein
VPKLTLKDRLLAWLVTGPVGRGAAFVADVAVLAVRSLRRRGPEAGNR